MGIQWRNVCGAAWAMWEEPSLICLPCSWSASASGRSSHWGSGSAAETVRSRGFPSSSQRGGDPSRGAQPFGFSGPHWKKKSYLGCGNWTQGGGRRPQKTDHGKNGKSAQGWGPGVWRIEYIRGTQIYVLCFISLKMWLTYYKILEFKRARGWVYSLYFLISYY